MQYVKIQDKYNPLIDKLFSIISGKNVDRFLEYIDFGGDFGEIAEKEELKYTDTVPYLTDIQSEKQNLVNNLRTKGVYADINESIASLVNKVLEIKSNE